MIAALFVGLLLTLLDCVSYGIALFPSDEAYIHLPKLGVQMYALSSACAQLVFALGSSFSRGVVAATMVEAIPYLHEIGRKVAQGPSAVPTQIVAMALSTLLLAVAFILLRMFHGERFLQQFPRQVLLGSTGGISIFLGFTAKTLCGHSKWQTALPIFLALGLFVLQKRINSPLLIPVFCLLSIAIFYIAVYLFGQSFDSLRSSGWLFNYVAPEDAQFSFGSLLECNWPMIFKVLPGIAGLVVFGMLHVPINVPAYSLATAQPADMRRELTLHGAANLLSSLTACPVYFVYTNSVLFFRCGANSRIESILLAALTVPIVSYGFALLSYTPRLTVCFLVFFMCLGLCWIAFAQSLKKCRNTEYATIVGVALVMAIRGFTFGLVAGVAAAFAQVVSDSSAIPERPTIGAVHIYGDKETGFLRECEHVICTVYAPTNLFFGNAIKLSKSVLENLNRSLYVILDCSGTASIDITAREELQTACRLNRVVTVGKYEIAPFAHFESVDDAQIALNNTLLHFLRNEIELEPAPEEVHELLEEFRSRANSHNGKDFPRLDGPTIVLVENCAVPRRKLRVISGTLEVQSVPGMLFHANSTVDLTLLPFAAFAAEACVVVE